MRKTFAVTTAAEEALSHSLDSFFLRRLSSSKQSTLLFQPEVRLRLSRGKPTLGSFVTAGQSVFFPSPGSDPRPGPKQGSGRDPEPMPASGPGSGQNPGPDPGSGPSVRVFATSLSDEVAREVFSAVLNGSQLVDFRLPSATHVGDTYFFVKSPLWRSAEDLVQLRRLGHGKVNLTVHEGQKETTASKILDVRVHLADAVVSIRYGVSAAAERTRLLRHALKLSAKRAWIRERQSPNMDWTPEEKRQLQSRGFVDNVEAVFAKDVDEFPELANDIDNVRFVKRRKKQT